MFSWVPFFEAVGRAILASHDSHSLALLYYNVFPEKGLIDLKSHQRFSQIDPFVFIARMNGNEKPSTRIELCSRVAEALRVAVPVPTDFSGIPIFQNMALWFADYQNLDGGGAADIKAHWNLFSALMSSEIADDIFRRSLKVRGVGVSKLTQAFYILRPDKFLPCDKNTLSLSESFGGIGSFDAQKDVPFSEYCNYVLFLRGKFPGKTNPEISYEAHTRRDTKGAVDERRPNYFVAGTYVAPDGSEKSEVTAVEMVRRGVWECGFRLDDERGDAARKVLGGILEGDFIALKASYVRERKTSTMRIDAIGRVTGNSNNGKTLEVDWLWSGPAFELAGTSYQKTIEKVVDRENIERIFAPVLNPKNSVNGEKSNIPGAPLNIIYYGPPGTGKTLRIIEKAKEYTSATGGSRASDLIMWLKERTWWEVIAAVLIDSKAYDPGSALLVPEIARHKFVTTKMKFSTTKTPKNTIWGQLQYHTIPESKTVSYEKRAEPLAVDKTDDSKWFLTGNWRDELSDVADGIRGFNDGSKTRGGVARYHEFVTFHQSYGYEDFVEGIRPVVREGEGMTYEWRDGVFKDLCIRAASDPANRYAIFIDEINRGNISKIFGELITLIEPDKRAGGKHQMSVRLPGSGQEFSVPGNLDIYGTMNSVDRSVALVDMALRRRFKFVALRPDPMRVSEVVGSGDVVVKMREVFQRLNSKIELLLGSEFCLGHSYFDLDTVKDVDGLRANWFGQVLPLLQEYLFDDWVKLKALVPAFVKSETVKGLGEEMSVRTECHRFVGDSMSDVEFCDAMNSIAE